jgi:hypothetical protein
VTAAAFVDDAEFRALIAAWVADRRCPVGLSDWLREHDLDDQAEAAAWAADAPDRCRDPFTFDDYCGPFPFETKRGDLSYLGSTPAKWEMPCASGLPTCLIGAVDSLGSRLGDGYLAFRTCEEALVALLDGWSLWKSKVSQYQLTRPSV